MPYKDPQRKWEWEQRHRAQRVARRRKPTEEKELPIDIYGVAELRRDEQSLDWELLGINLDKSVAAEEYGALVAAEIPQGGAQS